MTVIFHLQKSTKSKEFLKEKDLPYFPSISKERFNYYPSFLLTRWTQSHHHIDNRLTDLP